MGSFGSLFFYEEIIMELFDFAFISNYDDRLRSIFREQIFQKEQIIFRNPKNLF